MFKCIEQAPKGGKWRIRLYFRGKPVDKKHFGNEYGWLQNKDKRNIVNLSFIFTTKKEAERDVVSFISALKAVRLMRTQ
jgi:hypothetical protein